MGKEPAMRSYEGRPTTSGRADGRYRSSESRTCPRFIAQQSGHADEAEMGRRRMMTKQRGDHAGPPELDKDFNTHSG